jgi:hypothetical protein
VSEFDTLIPRFGARVGGRRPRPLPPGSFQAPLVDRVVESLRPYPTSHVEAIVIFNQGPLVTNLTNNGTDVPITSFVTGVIAHDVIPEPSSLALCGLGAVALAGYSRRRTRRLNTSAASPPSHP